MEWAKVTLTVVEAQCPSVGPGVLSRLWGRLDVGIEEAVVSASEVSVRISAGCQRSGKLTL